MKTFITNVKPGEAPHINNQNVKQMSDATLSCAYECVMAEYNSRFGKDPLNNTHKPSEAHTGDFELPEGM
ncbi:hypothetical protein AB4113_01255 [Vibrio breoganii]